MQKNASTIIDLVEAFLFYTTRHTTFAAEQPIKVTDCGRAGVIKDMSIHVPAWLVI
jgi:hypothetical protein